MTYVVCNKPLNVETNTYCEFDGEVEVLSDGSWRCPACGWLRFSEPVLLRGSSLPTEEA